ncbi:hypothetical protein COY16_00780 [Candidatus Roizmanbacteria bacterium CG_4_10_14_0_2_um_filter_39_13]|uniref:Uncharacterized protein n=1 Tax=Candidatus Roizmanbacteria bacterium CG_4_10_14_0_2_um_filter_39_13 TaxID=1974825 RepID=A0A2M7U1D9_9BACT|nr:MAG: hypothetical protein COY16_00780 [Candidatus Roizmanbacteria bacterium CG_4_10_14_0_2_um_filter_39_13]
MRKVYLSILIVLFLGASAVPVAAQNDLPGGKRWSQCYSITANDMEVVIKTDSAPPSYWRQIIINGEYVLATKHRWFRSYFDISGLSGSLVIDPGSLCQGARVSISRTKGTTQIITW